MWCGADRWTDRVKPLYPTPTSLGGGYNKWCSNYIWEINKYIAYYGATYIRGLTINKVSCVVYSLQMIHIVLIWQLFMHSGSCFVKSCFKSIFFHIIHEYFTTHGVVALFCGYIVNYWRIIVFNKLVFFMVASQALYIDGLVRDYCNSNALAMELLQSCTKPSLWLPQFLWNNPLQLLLASPAADSVFTI